MLELFDECRENNGNFIEKPDKIARNKHYRISINDIEFEWDTQKNEITVKKHGLSFEEAAEIFANEDTILVYDEEHSDLEDRYNAIGFCKRSQLIVVCHCYRENDIIRIVSARKADREEVQLYYENQEV